MLRILGEVYLNNQNILQIGISCHPDTYETIAYSKTKDMFWTHHKVKSYKYMKYLLLSAFQLTEYCLETENTDLEL